MQGATHNNLKNIDLSIPLNELTVITGVSGSGKSSLAFDTIYAEGQRRYVETFSPYARQFLEQMDRPKVEAIHNVPPAVAIDQVNPVRTSRSTVGTMTEINDHLKLLFARMASLYCPNCGQLIKRQTSDAICDAICRQFNDAGMIRMMFPIRVPASFSTEYAMEHLQNQGYTRIAYRQEETVMVIQDRVRPINENRARMIEAIEVALQRGRNTVVVQLLDEQGQGVGKEFTFTDQLRCCDIDYSACTPNQFSFNSPLGACDTCRGFGKTMGIDYELVIPVPRLSLREGAIDPLNYRRFDDDYYHMIDCAEQQGIPVDVPWWSLNDEQQRWVIDGDGSSDFDEGWCGVKRFFDWLEGRRYRMYVRNILSYYRRYVTCEGCLGARLKAEVFNWRLGTEVEALVNMQKFHHPSIQMSDDAFAALPGLTIHDVASIPIARCVEFFNSLQLPEPFDEAASMLLAEIRARLSYLNSVGLGYLNLDRQSRTLSGGEVQRINLTTALGTTLVNTLFVLDEPTIGLHSRDVGRIVEILHRLRDLGNTILVVEHEEQIIRAADKVADLGPAPGEAGGHLVHFGPFSQLLECKESVTGTCLRDGNYLPQIKSQGRAPDADCVITIRGATQNNLKNIDVVFPLERMVCVTGVSGSGKSTLVEELLYRGMYWEIYKHTETPGEYRSIEGVQHVNEVVMVSQAAIGTTFRSNPGIYVGAMTPIREIFSQQPLAKQRWYREGHFSFNSELGRCEQCEGAGHEHIEMQFLSDVYLRCVACNGARFRPEVCQVKIHPVQDHLLEKYPEPLSIVDVHNLSVADALEFFQDDHRVVRALTPLVDVGLDYLSLGQPLPTLSGGEAQRLKLAGHIYKYSMAKRKSRDRVLFIFDEPTTGLHFTDVAKLITAIRKLTEKGHSVVIIEHNLDLISTADWLIDLGPDGGEFGGELIAEGSPTTVAEKFSTATAVALRNYFAAEPAIGRAPSVVATTENHSSPEICVHHAREHNLQNISVAIPYDAMTVITGMSGSGKSTLAFDILFAEGQKRYLATINAYARQYIQPAPSADFDLITGLPPTVAISQMLSRGGHRSTVATMTEIYHYIRLLYVRFGIQYCPDCHIEVRPRTVDSIVRQIMDEQRTPRIEVLAPLVISRKGNHNPWQQWALRHGAAVLLVDGELHSLLRWQPLDRYQLHTIDMPIQSVDIAADNDSVKKTLTAAIEKALIVKDGQIRIAYPALNVEADHRTFELYSTSRSCPSCAQAFLEPDPRQFSYNSPLGWCEECKGTGRVAPIANESQPDEPSDPENDWEVCRACKGRRLNPQSLAVEFNGVTIDQMTRWTVREAQRRLSELTLSEREAIATSDLMAEISARLEFLESVGLGYLSLDRAAPTLSGGEAQRIRLAAQLGSNLCGACYILDEPTIGLHSRDNQLLLSALHSLRDKGNTIIVVEHDEATIVSADHIIDLGPGGGVRGGEVIAEGNVKQIRDNIHSITGKMLKNPLQHPMARTRTTASTDEAITLHTIRRHNLNNINVSFPVRSLICVTGVSGSGKSTLVREVLYPNLADVLSPKSAAGKKKRWLHCKTVNGWQNVRRVLEVDQRPIGKTPRSCPVTYVNVMQTIRNLFAETTEARLRGYKASRFSFNLAEGHCLACGGKGEKKIEMNFLPDVRVLCESCNGARFNSETLNVRYRGKSIAEVLDLSVEEAQTFFSAVPKLARVFGLLVNVGLGYLRIGQPSPTLSGGEAQRIKLVSELSKALSRNQVSKPTARKSDPARGTLYLLDEPTVGLHAADVENLLKVIHALVDAGNTVVVIEHNLDVISEADWVIDMGPEGGDGGGKVLVQGKLSKLLQSKRSHTAQALREFRQRTAVNN